MLLEFSIEDFNGQIEIKEEELPQGIIDVVIIKSDELKNSGDPRKFSVLPGYWEFCSSITNRIEEHLLGKKYKSTNTILPDAARFVALSVANAYFTSIVDDSLIEYSYQQDRLKPLVSIRMINTDNRIIPFEKTEDKVIPEEVRLKESPDGIIKEELDIYTTIDEADENQVVIHSNTKPDESAKEQYTKKQWEKSKHGGRR